MRLEVDLRLLLPPLNNTILAVLQLLGVSWCQDGKLVAELLDHPVLFMFVGFTTLIFLSVSFKVPLGTFGPTHLGIRDFPLPLPVSMQSSPILYPISVKVGEFSLSLTVALLVSIVFPPSRFWLSYPILSILNFWNDALSRAIKSLIRWLSHTLKSVAIYIVCYFKHDGEPEAAASSIATESLDIEHGDMCVSFISG